MMATMTSRPDQLRVILADDHPPIREVVRRRVEEQPRFQVVGEAGDIPQALAQLAATSPHLAVIDIGLGKVNGLMLARLVRERHPETRVLIWSMHDRAEYVAEARDAGARGYVIKTCRTDEIVKALGVVADGGCYYSAGLDRTWAPRPELTTREKQVLKLVACAKSSRQIAKQMKIDVRTVESHRRNIASKLGAKNVVEMITIAFRLGLLDLME